MQACILEMFVKSRDQSDPPPILTVQPTGRDIQQPRHQSLMTSYKVFLTTCPVSTTDHNIGDGPGSQFPPQISLGYITHGGISPGQSNSIQLHGGNAGFQATISTSLNQVENNPGPNGSTQACGGNAPRPKLQDYTQSENAQILHRSWWVCPRIIQFKAGSISWWK